jgi:hypothetical protein
MLGQILFDQPNHNLFLRLVRPGRVDFEGLQQPEGDPDGQLPFGLLPLNKLFERRWRGPLGHGAI